MSRSLSSRCPLVALLLGAGLLLTSLEVAVAVEPIPVALLQERVARTEDGARVQVMFSDRRAPAEGGDLVGRVVTADGQAAVRADGPGPAEALEELLLAVLRDIGTTASVAEDSRAPIALQIRLYRYWIGGDSIVTGQIDLELVKWSTRTGTKLATRRIEAQGMSRDALPGAAQDAARRAMLNLGREFADEVEYLLYDVDDGPMPSPFAGSTSGDSLALAAQPLARQPGARMRRNVGVGAGARIGVETIPDREIAEVQSEFLSFELRLVGGDIFSFDWTADVIGPLIIGADTDRPAQIRTAWFLHFAVATRGRVSFALAPGAHLTVFPDKKPKWNEHIVYGALRIGADIASPGREFGLGLYLRPQIGAALGHPEDGTRIELYAEVTWTLYAGRWGMPRAGI